MSCTFSIHLVFCDTRMRFSRLSHATVAIPLYNILSTAYHPHSQGSLSTRVRHGRGVKTANYIPTRVNKPPTVLRRHERARLRCHKRRFATTSNVPAQDKNLRAESWLLRYRRFAATAPGATCLPRRAPTRCTTHPMCENSMMLGARCP